MFLNFLVPFQLFFEGSLGSFGCLLSIAFAVGTCFWSTGVTLPLLIVAIRALLGQNGFAKNLRVIEELMAAAGALMQAAFQHHATKEISQML